MAQPLPQRPFLMKRRATSIGGDIIGQQHEFPVLFTIDGSSRHEVILINPGLELQRLKAAMRAVAESPNCAELLSKYRNNKATQDTIGEIRVKWSTDHDKQLWPKHTLLTPQNTEAVLRMMALGAGRDIFDIKIVQEPVNEFPASSR